MKNNFTLPASVKSSFDKSFEKVNENLLWFDMYSDGISQWALQNKIEKEQTEKEQKEREQKEKEQKKKEEERTTSNGTSTTTTVTPPTVVTQPSEKTTPKPSSASSNAYNSIIILQLAVLTLIVKAYIL